MKNNFYLRMLELIKSEKDAFNTLVNADNALGLNVTSEDIVNFLEFMTNDNILNAPLIGNVVITEGDILTILKLIRDIMDYEGEYIIYINEDNVGTITYLISRANLIYKEFNLNLILKIDYSENYNSHITKLVTIIGSEEFVNTAAKDFSSANKIVM